MSSKVIRSKTTHSLQTPVEKKVSTSRSSESRRKSFSDKPNPLDFDAFIPWVCLEWQSPDIVTVTRMVQEKLIRSERRASSAKSKSIKSIRVKEDGDSTSKRRQPSDSPTGIEDSIEDTIDIKAYYDGYGHLAEISIDANKPFHRKVIQAVSLCLPFHAFLTKLVFRKRGLNYILLHEISKLLPHSNLTDICFDDTYVPEGNYYVLLDYNSNLKYLSLNRCKINDSVCKELASRIDFGRLAEKSLAALDLSTNLITDIGAKYFGDVLRRNRHLLHLNLQGNKIGDEGCFYLLEHLQEFPLTYEELMDKQLISLQYIKRKHEIYEHCVTEIAHNAQKSEVSLVWSEKRTSVTKGQTKFKKNKKSAHHGHHVGGEEHSQISIIEQMTRELLGEFYHPFNDSVCVKRNNYLYSTGNLRLCSLNIAYNNIEYLSLLKVLEVLKYQSVVEKHPPNTGLIRIVLEGNYFPNSCPELEMIDLYLKQASSSQVPIPHSNTKRRTSFHTIILNLTHSKSLRFSWGDRSLCLKIKRNINYSLLWCDCGVVYLLNCNAANTIPCLI